MLANYLTFSLKGVKNVWKSATKSNDNDGGFEMLQNEEISPKGTTPITQKDGVSKECVSSKAGSKDDEGEAASCERLPNSINEFQAGINISSALQGLSIVSFPYAVLNGGYLSLLSIFVIGSLSFYTGYILIECLYDEVENNEIEMVAAKTDEKKVAKKRRVRARSSYTDIASVVWGKQMGFWSVMVMQMIDWMFNCLSLPLLCGQLLKDMIGLYDLSVEQCIAIAGIPFLGFAFIKTLKHVAIISTWNFVLTVIFTSSVLVYCISKYSVWQPAVVEWKVEVKSLSVSLGIVLFSFTTHMYFPLMEDNMVVRSNFNRMLLIIHSLSIFLKLIFSYLGFLTFGLMTNEVVTNNIELYPFKLFLNATLALKCLLGYPLPFFAIVETLDRHMFNTNKLFPPCISYNGLDSKLKPWAIIVRMVMVLSCIAIGVLIPHYALFNAFIGSISGYFLCFIWPCWFYVALKRHQLSYITITFNLAIIFFAIVGCVTGTFLNLEVFYQTFHGNTTQSSVNLTFSNAL